jgi:putative flippase GtrA
MIRVLAQSFSRFALIGVAGLAVDTTVLYLARWAGAGLLSARLISYLCAATFTWYANRRFTFAMHLPPSVQEWLRFIAANTAGGSVNYATYAALVWSLPVVAAHPFLGVAAGSASGLLLNFSLSRHVVFAQANIRETQ